MPTIAQVRSARETSRVPIDGWKWNSDDTMRCSKRCERICRAIRGRGFHTLPVAAQTVSVSSGRPGRCVGRHQPNWYCCGGPRRAPCHCHISQHQDRPNPLPTWGDWRRYVGFAGRNLVGQLHTLQLAASGNQVADKTFALIIYERQQIDGELRLTQVALHQADRLEELLKHLCLPWWANLVHAAEKWFGKRLAGHQRRGAEELPRPVMEEPKSQWRPGTVIVAPDAVAIDRARRHLADLLKPRTFDVVTESHMPPMITPQN